MSTVYLLHFQRPIGNPRTPYGQAQHYIGLVENSERLEDRLDQHRGGQGAKIMAAVVAAGIAWECVRTWEGDGALERKLKNRKDTPSHLCPICRATRRKAVALLRRAA